MEICACPISRVWSILYRAVEIGEARGQLPLSPPVHCVLKWGFMQTFCGNQDKIVKLMYELISLNNFADYKAICFAQMILCINPKKTLSLRHPSSNFSYFQISLWLGVDKGLQKLPKSDKNELRLLFDCFILISRKCPLKIPFQHTVPPAILAGGEAKPSLWKGLILLHAPQILDLPTALIVTVLCCRAQFSMSSRCTWQKY